MQLINFSEFLLVIEYTGIVSAMAK